MKGNLMNLLKGDVPETSSVRREKNRHDIRIYHKPLGKADKHSSQETKAGSFFLNVNSFTSASLRQKKLMLMDYHEDDLVNKEMKNSAESIEHETEDEEDEEAIRLEIAKRSMSRGTSRRMQKASSDVAELTPFSPPHLLQKEAYRQKLVRVISEGRRIGCYDLSQEILSPRGAILKESLERNLIPFQIKEILKTSSSAGCVDAPVETGFEITTLDVKNKGLGDEKAICIAAALPFCRQLSSLNLAGNRLTDKSIKPILTAMLENLRVTSLDVSDNKMDSESIDVLKANCVDPNCRLTQLHLSKSDIDDEECADFMKAMAVNTSITKLNLSHNMIGGMEEKKPLSPDFMTGAEAIAVVLSTTSSLTFLDLSHNNIRKTSAMGFAKCLAHNSSLLVLNLANNNFGDIAGQHLAHSLRFNTTIKFLDISYNNLMPKSIFCFANVLEQSNKTLKEVNFNGNSVGREGCKCLLRAMREAAKKARILRLHFRDSNTDYEDRNIFDRDKPTSLYNLNLDDPYEYSVALTIFRIADTSPVAFFKQIKYKVGSTKGQEGRGGAWTNVNLIRPPNKLNSNGLWESYIRAINTSLEKITILQQQQQQQQSVDKALDMAKQDARAAIKGMGKCMRLNLIDIICDKVRLALLKLDEKKRNKTHQIFHVIFQTVFAIVDRDKSGSIDVDELARGLFLLGIDGIKDDPKESFRIAKRMIAGVDVDGNETLDEVEWTRMLFSRYADTWPGSPNAFVDKVTGRPWIVPTSGTLEIDFYSDKLPPTLLELNTDDSIAVFASTMTTTLKSEEEKVNVMATLQSSSDLFLTCEQAETLLKNFRDRQQHWISTVEKMLPQMSNTQEACRFLAQNLKFDDIVKLRLRMGFKFKAITGNACGHYFLDLSNSADRAIARKIASLNSLDKSKTLSETPERNTSQEGNYENFRNGSINRKYVALSSDFFQTDPRAGKCSFDFISTVRPVRGIEPISKEAMIKLLRLVFPEGLPIVYNVEEEEEAAMMAAAAAAAAAVANSSLETKGESSPKRKSKLKRSMLLSNATNSNNNGQASASKKRGQSHKFSEKEAAWWSDFIDTSFRSYKSAREMQLTTTLKPILTNILAARGGGGGTTTSAATLISDEAEEKMIYKEAFASEKYKLVTRLPLYRVDLTHLETKGSGGGGIESLPRARAAVMATKESTKKKRPLSNSITSGKLVLSPLEERVKLINRCMRFELYLARLETYLIFNIYVSVAQVKEIIQAFIAQGAPNEVLVCIVCIIFTRIIDLDNIADLFSSITPDTKQELIHRIGYLNIFSPMNPNGFYELDLAAQDERKAARAFLKLAVKEGGYERLTQQEYVVSIAESPSPQGWEVPLSWSEEGLPTFGQVSFVWADSTDQVNNWQFREDLSQTSFLAGSFGTYLPPSIDDDPKDEVSTEQGKQIEMEEEKEWGVY